MQPVKSDTDCQNRVGTKRTPSLNIHWFSFFFLFDLLSLQNATHCVKALSDLCERSVCQSRYRCINGLSYAGLLAVFQLQKDTGQLCEAQRMSKLWWSVRVRERGWWLYLIRASSVATQRRLSSSVSTWTHTCVPISSMNIHGKVLLVYMCLCV